MKKRWFWIALLKNENLMFLKLSSEREKFEWYWHPESKSHPKIPWFFIIFQIPWFSMHGFFFSHFPCFLGFPEPVGTLPISGSSLSKVLPYFICYIYLSLGGSRCEDEGLMTLTFADSTLPYEEIFLASFVARVDTTYIGYLKVSHVSRYHMYAVPTLATNES